MKQLLIIAIVLFSFSFTTNDEKKYSLSLTPAETDLLYGALGQSRVAISNSNIPAKEALQLMAVIDSAQRLILKQVQPQIKK